VGQGASREGSILGFRDRFLVAEGPGFLEGGGRTWTSVQSESY
jgi:hypothetical protein